MAKLILSTGNIVSGGPSIIRKPGAFRSNLELTNSLRSNFLAAQQDYAAAAGAANCEGSQGSGEYDEHPASSSSSPPPSRGGGGGGGGRRPKAEVWTERDGPVLYVPRINWDAAGLQEDASQYEITVKMFYLAAGGTAAAAPATTAADRARQTREALSLVRRELGGVPGGIDLLIASFPGLAFEGDCEWEADKRNALQGDAEAEMATWQALEELLQEENEEEEEGGRRRKGRLVKSLGVAEFGSEKLATFLEKGVKRVRPAVDQINVRDCCNVPPPLLELARREGIELTVHSDCADILPPGTLRDLLGHGFQGAGILADPEAEDDGGGEGLEGDLVPLWVVKYTALVRDRGVIENKGYFAGAEIVESKTAGPNGTVVTSP